VLYSLPNGRVVEANLLDFGLEIIDSREGSVTFAIKNGEVEWRGVFSLDDINLFQAATEDQPDLVVHRANEDVWIEDYLNEELPSFYTSDLSAIEGTNFFPVPTDLEPFANDSFESVDWAQAAVDIAKEKPSGDGDRSIFEWLQERLVASSASLVFCDDGSGEMADFITIHPTEKGPRVKLFHCKGSGDRTPGNRVDDLYDVCGQAVKSSVWLKPDHFLNRLKHRATLDSVTGYVKGDEATAHDLLSQENRQQVQFEMYIVQPGVKKEGRTEAVSNILAAARFYLAQVVDVFGVIGS